MFGKKKKNIVVKKSELKKAIVKANESLSNRNKVLERMIEEKESKIKLLDSKIGSKSDAVNSEIEENKLKIAKIEAEFDSQKALLSREEGKLSELENKSQEMISQNLQYRDESNLLIENIKKSEKKELGLRNNIVRLENEKNNLKKEIKDVDFLTKQKELLEEDIRNLKSDHNGLQEMHAKFKKDHHKSNQNHNKNTAKMREDIDKLTQEYHAVSKSLDVAQKTHKIVCDEYKSRRNEEEVNLQAMKNMVKDKEIEFIRVDEKILEAKDRLENEEFKVEKIKENFKEWKIKAVEEMAKLKLKNRIDNIDKAGLKEILSGN